MGGKSDFVSISPLNGNHVLVYLPQKEVMTGLVFPSTFLWPANLRMRSAIAGVFVFSCLFSGKS